MYILLFNMNHTSNIIGRHLTKNANRKENPHEKELLTQTDTTLITK